MSYRVNILILTFALILITSPGQTQAPFPQWSAGTVYYTEDFYRLTTPYIGSTGYLEINTESTYTVTGRETIDQEKGSIRGVECWRLDFGSHSFHGQGQVDFSNPFNFQGPVFFTRGSVIGTFWFRTSDLAVVKRHRVFEGDMQVEISGFPVPAGSMTLTDNEEYDPPLQDIKFPLDLGDFWRQLNLVMHFFGSLDFSLFGSYPFYGPLPKPMIFETQQMEFLPVGTGDCNTYHIVTQASQVHSTLDTWYCPKAKWFIKQEFQDVPLGPVGMVEMLRIRVTDYEHGGATPTPAIPTPTPAISSTPTPTRPFVLMGGYWDTTLTAGQDGEIRLQAVVTDSRVDSVEILFSGLPTGLELRDNGLNGDATAGDDIYTWRLRFFRPAQRMRLLFEVRAFDTQGRDSHNWPYLVVE